MHTKLAVEDDETELVVLVVVVGGSVVVDGVVFEGMGDVEIVVDELMVDDEDRTVEMRVVVVDDATVEETGPKVESPVVVVDNIVLLVETEDFDVEVLDAVYELSEPVVAIQIPRDDEIGRLAKRPVSQFVPIHGFQVCS